MSIEIEETERAQVEMEYMAELNPNIFGTADPVSRSDQQALLDALIRQRVMARSGPRSGDDYPQDWYCSD